MSFPAHIVDGARAPCPCGGWFEAGTASDGGHGVAHSDPECARFVELDTNAYVLWVLGTRSAMPCAAVLARAERAHAAGRAVS